MLPERFVKELERALRNLRYGTVQLIVHEAQVVRIERVERIRLTGSPEARRAPTGQPTPTAEVRPDDHEEI
jgi:hypothetical protein